MYPHPIRLRGPWECQPLAWANGSTANLPAARRVTLPGRLRDIGLESFAGTIRLSRRFGTPRKIDPHERVWLALGGITGATSLRLNDAPLGQHHVTTLELDVTGLLQRRNELVVDLAGDSEEAGLWGEVALEVRCTAWLRNVAVEIADGRLRATGEVAGDCERGILELYLLLDGATLAYATTSAGQPFTLEGIIDPKRLSATPGHLARVDLVNAAAIWYVKEQVVHLGAVP